MFTPTLQKALRKLGFTFYADGRVVHKRTQVTITSRDDRELCWLTLAWPGSPQSVLMTIPTAKLLEAAGIKATADEVIVDSIKQQKLAAADPGQP
jgi:hypothetical protein